MLSSDNLLILWMLSEDYDVQRSSKFRELCSFVAMHICRVVRHNQVYTKPILDMNAVVSSFTNGVV